MFGSVGMPELILIFVVALLVFGPKKLPEIGKSLGKGLAEFKRASEDLKKTIEDEIEAGKREAASLKQEVTEAKNLLAPPAVLPTEATPPAGEQSAPPAAEPPAETPRPNTTA
jgi:TatA/E family protein of Tat protein translocase